VETVLSVRALSISDEVGWVGCFGHLVRGGPQAWCSVMQGGSLAGEGSAESARGVQGPNGSRDIPQVDLGGGGGGQEGVDLKGVVNRRPKPLERRGRESWAAVGSEGQSAGIGCSIKGRAARSTCCSGAAMWANSRGSG
jgi:hypothetical protein